MRRNYIEFIYGEDHDVLILMHKPEYIKVQIHRTSDYEQKLHDLCPRIMELIATTIRNVSGSMMHSLYTDKSKDQYKHYFENYCFAFECYEHEQSDHLCTVSKSDLNPKNMTCVKEKTSSKMKPEHQVWYGKVSTCYYP